jgi:prepilin-type processing-associated H-X9-DG protein
MFRRTDGWEVKMSDVRDGLSNTILLGEALIPDGADRMRTIERCYVNPPGTVNYHFPTQAQIDAWGQAGLTTGSDWSMCCGSDAWYFPCLWINECGPPNWRYQNTTYGGTVCGQGGTWHRGHAVRPPRSRHPGGVNVALGDASVRFVSETVDLTTFQRMGARDDGLPVAIP